MKILCSSVIRSTQKGESHGGIYFVNTETKHKELLIDWDDPTIDFYSGGGDRGIRGMLFHGEYLYAAGAKYLYMFDKNFNLVNKFDNINLDGTHELCLFNESEILNISNCFDAIIAFDVNKQEWTWGFQHIKGKRLELFNPSTDIISRVDSLHLDSVSSHGNWIWYAGSTTEYLYGFNIKTRKFVEIPLIFKNTHNAQYWKDGIIFNRSLESDTTYQVPVDPRSVYIQYHIEKHWKTPVFPKNKLMNANIPADHARSEYTRGMVLGEDSIVIGTSPATVHEFVLEKDEPINTVNLSNDLRNSICGMVKYDW